MVQRKRQALIVLTATAAIIALVGGIAWAAIPEGNVVHACFATPGGALRAVDVSTDCATGESAVALGGPTRAYSFANPANVDLSSTTVRVGSVDLVTGTYLVHGKVNISNQNFTALGSTFVPCTLRLLGTTPDQTWMIVPSARTGLNASNASISLQAAVTVPADPGKATLEMQCASLPRTAGPAAGVIARYRQLQAVQVDSLQATS
jgi:hypothetical protein